MRRFFAWLMLAVFLLIMPVKAGAHGAGINAVLSTEPANLTPGEPARISVGLYDVYNSPIPAATMRVRVEQAEHPGQPAAELHELSPGTYTGTLTVAGPGFVVLRVEATLPDGLWSGQLAAETGPDGTQVSEMGVELLHQDAVPTASGTYRMWATIAVVGLLLVMVFQSVRTKRR